MSGMGQLTKLWRDDMKGGLPVMFNIFNNQYAMGGQTVGETMGYDAPARLGAGFNPNQMLAERVDGFNPLAVIEAYGRKKKLLLEGKTYNQVIAEADISSATLSRVSRCVQYGNGYSQLLK